MPTLEEAFEAYMTADEARAPQLSRTIPIEAGLDPARHRPRGLV